MLPPRVQTYASGTPAGRVLICFSLIKKCATPLSSSDGGEKKTTMHKVVVPNKWKSESPSLFFDFSAEKVYLKCIGTVDMDCKTSEVQVGWKRPPGRR